MASSSGVPLPTPQLQQVREVADLIHDLTMVHWRFGNRESDEVEAHIGSRRDALTIAAALSARVGAFGDVNEANAREAYRKGLAAQRMADDEAGGAGGSRPRPRRKLGR